MHYQHPTGSEHTRQPAAGVYYPAGQYDPQYNAYEYQYGYDGTYSMAPEGQYASDWSRGWFTFSDSRYMKGFLVGVGAALILANPTVQRTLIKGVVKLWSGVEYGLEEVKEQIKDIKAESDTQPEGES